MHSQSAAQQDTSIGVTPPLQPSMPWRVASVEPLPEYRLHVRFLDGKQGVVDLAELIQSANAGIFAVLADPLIFSQVFVKHGVVTWPGEIDLAPDAMYAKLS